MRFQPRPKFGGAATVVFLVTGILAAGIPASAQSAQNSRYANKLAPSVFSPTRVVDLMLDLANLKPNETLFDLGSGDGRILIAAAGRYKAKAVGIEISPRLVAKANAAIRKQGLDGRAHVMEGDLLDSDLSGLANADVVTIYLATSLNEKLRPTLEKYLKPGARVISHDYAVRGWKPTRVEHTDDKHMHLVYLYEMPPLKN